MRFFYLIVAAFECFLSIQAFQSHKNQDEYFAANLLRAVVDRMNNEYSNGYPDPGRSELQAIRTRLAPTIIKEEDDEPSYADVVDEDNIITSIRDNEFLQHSSLWGQQYMTGGAGEGKQNLKPEGSIPNKNEVKTDAVLPAYCNPPNPCPVGFSADDGCIQQFENTAAFSREYQAAQKCMCDSEHMFDCPSSHEFSYDNDLEFEPMVRRFKMDQKERNVKKIFPEKIPTVEEIEDSMPPPPPPTEPYPVELLQAARPLEFQPVASTSKKRATHSEDEATTRVLTSNPVSTASSSSSNVAPLPVKKRDARSYSVADTLRSRSSSEVRPPPGIRVTSVEVRPPPGISTAAVAVRHSSRASATATAPAPPTSIDPSKPVKLSDVYS